MKRPSIEDALIKMKELKSIGNDSVNFEPYMRLLKQRVINDPSSLGLPENIEEIRKLYIKTEVTNLDSFKYPN